MTSAAYRENYAQIEWAPLPDEPRVYTSPKRSSLVAPYIISDTMEPAQHPCTGEYLSSKSRFARTTREHDCIEVGNDPARHRPRPKPKADKTMIRETILRVREQARSGTLPRRSA